MKITFFTLHFSATAQDKAIQSGNQEYTILIVFTNGNVHSNEETIRALNEVQSDPLSIVIVGVGSGDFSSMKSLDDYAQGSKTIRDIVKFVEMKTHQQDEHALSEATLKEIPDQLVSYFVSRRIAPNVSPTSGEIVIEPFNEDDEVQAEVTETESGDIKVDSDAKPTSSTSKLGSLGASIGSKGAQQILNQGKRIMGRQRPQFGRIGQNFQRQFDRMVDGDINNLLKKVGINVPSQPQGRNYGR